MNRHNPYQAPPSLDEHFPKLAKHRHLAKAHQWIIGGFFLFFLSIATIKSLPIAWIIGLLALGLFIIGTVQLSRAFAYRKSHQILLIIGLFIPIINVIILLFLSHKATKILRQAGYDVGLLGARL